MYFLLQMGIFHCYVSLPEGKALLYKALTNHEFPFVQDPLAPKMTEKTTANSLRFIQPNADATPLPMDSFLRFLSCEKLWENGRKESWVRIW